MNDHSSRRSGAPWPAEDQPSSRREARSQRPVRRSRPRLGLLAGPAALLVVGAGLAATGISHAANDPATQDVVAPAAARGGQARAAAPKNNNGRNNNNNGRTNVGGNRGGNAPATTTTASVTTGATTSGTVVAGANGTGTITLPGNVGPNGRGAGAKMRLRHRGQQAPPCSLIVPQNPLSAQGLSTPYELVAPCDETVKDQAVFVQAAIITPEGEITLYNPLVITQGTKPFAEPIKAVVPRGSTVGIWFGANGDAMTLAPAAPNRQNRNARIPFGAGNSLTQGKCVNGLPGSIFGQYGYCNAPQFFSAAHRAIAKGHLPVPAPVGTDADGKPVPGTVATDGKACPTVRDFMVVDQDQSDNVNTHYWAVGKQTAQTFANPADGLDLANGSDNRLDTDFIKPALKCSTFMAPDQTNNMKLTASQPLQELEAALHQDAPVALVPLNDPMTLLNDKPSVRKTNLYRAGVDQPLIWGRGNNGNNGNNRNNRAATATKTTAADAAPADATATAAEAANLVEKDAQVAAPDAAPVADVQAQDARSRFRDNGSPLAYCQGMFQNPRGVARAFDNKDLFKAFKSANADDADSLFTFLALRAQGSFDILGCGPLLGIDNPITVFPATGKVTAASFNFNGTVLGDAITTTSTSTSASTSTVTSAPVTTTPTEQQQLMNGQPIIQAQGANQVAGVQAAPADQAAANGTDQNGAAVVPPVTPSNG
jgi:hypothetical protein